MITFLQEHRPILSRQEDIQCINMGLNTAYTTHTLEPIYVMISKWDRLL